MTTHRVFRTMIFLSALSLSHVTPTTCAQSILFADDFEAPSINLFWTVTQQSGTITLSGDNFHGGLQSTRFASTVITGLNKYLFLDHEFETQTYGRVSVWVYDAGADLRSGNSIYLGLENQSTGTSIYVTAPDYDNGPGAGGRYYVKPWGGAGIPAIETEIDRTRDWHNWEIETTWDGTTVRIDGIVVFDSPSSQSFDFLRMGMYAPSWRPAITSYFDDFLVVEHVSCPSDLDGNNEINLSDLSLLLSNFGCVGSECTGDITGDNMVGLDDLASLLAHFGTVCP